jgi:cytoskeletal protein RodZ
MDRRALLAVAGIVLVAAVILANQLRGRASPTADHTAATPTASSSSDPERPALPDQKQPEGTPVVAETTVDGVRIRDHRTGGEAQPFQPRTPDRATRAQRLPPELVHQINGKLQVMLAACTGAIPTEARSPRSRVGGTIQVDIVAGVLQVTEANVQLLNVEGETAQTAKQCLEQKWIGQSTAATGTADTTRYPITISFALPAA